MQTVRIEAPAGNRDVGGENATRSPARRSDDRDLRAGVRVLSEQAKVSRGANGNDILIPGRERDVAPLVTGGAEDRRTPPAAAKLAGILKGQSNVRALAARPRAAKDVRVDRGVTNRVGDPLV